MRHCPQTNLIVAKTKVREAMKYCNINIFIAGYVFNIIEKSFYKMISFIFQIGTNMLAGIKE